MASNDSDNGIPIINPVARPSWAKRNSSTLIAWAPAVASLIGALLSWYASCANTAVTREAVIAEHRPVLEIVSFGFADRTNMPLLIKNSGRSTALKLRTDIWMDVGKYSLPSPAWPPRFAPIKSFGPMQQYTPDTPTGGTFAPNLAIVPSLDWLRAYERFDDETSVRLRGAVHYEDSAHNQFELPFCYESFQPSRLEKPGAIPCYDIKPVQRK